MIDDILVALWFFAPAGVANAAPVIAAAIPALKRWDRPVDGGRSWRGQRLLGDHKTWRGFGAGILGAWITLLLQSWLWQSSAWIRDHSLIDYPLHHLWWLGLLFGGGALVGDAVASFFKRRLRRDPGTSWTPVDQLDYIIGGLLFVSFAIKLPLRQYVMILVIWFAVHIIATNIAYWLKLRERPHQRG